MTSIVPNPVVQVQVTNPTQQTVSVQPRNQTNVSVTTGTGFRAALSKEYQLISGRLIDYPTIHKEFSETDGVLTKIETWDGPEKETLLITVSLAYEGNNIVQKVVTDEISGIVLTVDFTYQGLSIKSLTESMLSP